MDLVIDHMFEALIVSRPEEDLCVHLASGETAVHHLIATLLIAIIVKDVRDLIICYY